MNYYFLCVKTGVASVSGGGRGGECVEFNDRGLEYVLLNVVISTQG